jgi:hypothetical protein
MLRKVLGAVGGVAAFMIIATVAGLILRASWPEYARSADAMTFTLSMKFTRLAIGALATIAAGWIATVIARRSVTAALLVAILLLLLFIPQHIRLWDKFPVWYHLTFLLSLVPLSYLGGKTSGSVLRKE